MAHPLAASPMNNPKLQATLALRNAAADCYVEAHGHGPLAAALLRKKYEGVQLPARLSRYCKNQFNKRQPQQNVNDAPRSGRPRKVSPEKVEETLTALLEDRKLGTDKEPFDSWNAFVREDATVKKILKDSSITPAALKRRCLEVRPHLQRLEVKLKGHLTEKHKEARVQECKVLLRQPNYKFDATIYIDAKKMYINPKTRHIIVDRADYDGTTAASKPKVPDDGKWCINYEIGVCSLCGPVAMYIATGTKDHPGDRVTPPFLVSTPELRPQMPC